MPAAPQSTTQPGYSAERSPLGGWLIVLIGLLLGVLLLAWGPGGSLAQRAIGVVLALLFSAWQPMIFMLGALGLGRLFRLKALPIGQRLAIQLGVGLTLTLTLTHGLGMLGLLAPLSAWIISGVGLVLLLDQISRLSTHEKQSVRASIHRLRSPIGLMCLFTGVLAVLMSSNPPGVLWDSEFGGYDALSYHLQLPAEWLDQGRVWPSDHNVYSYLPGYIECAFAHQALLAGGDMHSNDAAAGISAQYLALLMLLSSAWVIGLLSESAWRRMHASDPPVSLAPFSWLMALSTPWLMVVGTMAYNDIALVLLGGIALLVALSKDLSVNRRFLLCALIVAGACCCKPTAIFMLAPSVAVVLLATTPPRRWVPAMLLGLVVGAMTLSPWLIRNEIAVGNPVFPQLGSLFGFGDWTQEQHEIYRAAHHFDGSLIQRIGLLVLPDPGGVDHVSRYRGLSNLQWGITPLLGSLGILVLVVKRSTRRGGLVIAAAVLVAIAGWVLLTHIQSRFLIPLAPLLIVSAALGLGLIPARRVSEALIALIGLVSALWCVGIALQQNRSAPFAVIDFGPGVFLGEYELDASPWTARVNRISEPGDTVYLLGDATPFYITGAVRYNSVYDRWLLADVIEGSADDPDQWSDELVDQGITLVVVSFREIDRFAASGWLPDEISPDRLISWIDTLSEPIDVEQDPTTQIPIRAIFRIDQPHPSTQSPARP